MEAPYPRAPPPPPNPYLIAQAAAKAAKAAGWKIGKPPGKKSHFPLIMYRSPKAYKNTPGPPPSVLAYPIPGLMQEGVDAGLVQDDVEVEPEEPGAFDGGFVSGPMTPDAAQAFEPTATPFGPSMSALTMQSQQLSAGDQRWNEDYNNWKDHDDEDPEEGYGDDEGGDGGDGDYAQAPRPLPQNVMELADRHPMQGDVPPALPPSDGDGGLDDAAGPMPPAQVALMELPQLPPTVLPPHHALGPLHLMEQPRVRWGSGEQL